MNPKGSATKDSVFVILRLPQDEYFDEIDTVTEVTLDKSVAEEALEKL